MSKKVKSLFVLSIAGLMSACSGSSNPAAAPANNAVDKAPAPAAVQFTAAHSGNFEITGIGGDSPTDVITRDDLTTRIADYPGLTLAANTFDTMAAAEAHTYEWDSTNHILRLHGAGENLEITDTGTTVTEDVADAGDKGQTQVTKKEGPSSLPCALYREEAKQETKPADKGEVKPAPVDQGQASKEPAQASKEPAQASKEPEQATKEPAKEPAQASKEPEQASKEPAKTEPAAPAQGQDQSQEQKQEVQAPEQVMVRCYEELTSKDQGQDQKQSQEKPEVKNQTFFLMLNLTPVVETKQEQKGEVKPIANG